MTSLIDDSIKIERAINAVSPEAVGINDIMLDAGTQPRVHIDQGLIQDYAAEIEQGIALPSISCVTDGTKTYLVDGFHRLHAHKMAGREEIVARVASGTVQAARLYSCGVNAAHGLRRSKDDVRKAVVTVLSMYDDVSLRDVAAVCRCSHEQVRRIKASLAKPEPDTDYEPTESELADQAFAGDDPIPKSEDATPEPEPTAKAVPDAEPLRLAMSHLAKAAKSIKDIDTEDQIVTYLDVQATSMHIKNAYAAVKFALPHTVCPACNGEGCQSCRTCGWIPKDIANQVTKHQSVSS